MKKISKNSRARNLTELFLKNYPTSSRFAEAYRTLRTNVHFSFMDSAFRSILITSAGEREGKTSTAANFAYTLAQAGKSVLMIDADLRKPMLGKLIPSKESLGITGLISTLFNTDISAGSLENFGISDLISLLYLQKKTGMLHLSDGKEEVGFYFIRGELSDVKWFTRPNEKNMVNFLVGNRLITHKDAESALNRQKDTGQNLSFILVNMGFIKKEELKGPLNIYIMESIRIALQMKRGQFTFKELSESELEKRFSLDLVDIRQIYRDAISGEEKLPYLQKGIHSAILKVDENLFLLPGGISPPNPSELLGSERTSFLLSYLKKHFDVVIIDTPPILPASDALLLAPQLDGVMLIVKTGVVSRELIKKAVEQLQLAKANLLGVVLNQVDIKREGYYKYYHKYYSNYYHEDEKQNKKVQKDSVDEHPAKEISEKKDETKIQKAEKKFFFFSNQKPDNNAKGMNRINNEDSWNN